MAARPAGDGVLEIEDTAWTPRPACSLATDAGLFRATFGSATVETGRYQDSGRVVYVVMAWSGQAAAAR